jgi:trans-aconitate 2-methyltransferase
MRYTFGTDTINGRRLKSIADFFNPLAKEFIRQYLGNNVRTVIDLGCGPGFTTKMLGDIMSCRQIIGLDTSENYITFAREHYPSLFFFLQDVTVPPFPAKADVMYCRFLLSHLVNTTSVVNSWIHELHPRGILFLDEVEAVVTENPVFKRYLQVNDALIRSQGAELFIGNTLGHTRFKGTLIHNSCDILPVKNRTAASWFYPHAISIWENEDYVVKTVPEKERKKIAGELKKIMESDDTGSEITWHMRRIAIRKENE